MAHIKKKRKESKKKNESVGEEENNRGVSDKNETKGMGNMEKKKWT